MSVLPLLPSTHRDAAIGVARLLVEILLNNGFGRLPDRTIDQLVAEVLLDALRDPTDPAFPRVGDLRALVEGSESAREDWRHIAAFVDRVRSSSDAAMATISTRTAKRSAADRVFESRAIHGELELALAGKHSFGGDVVEIYAYRLAEFPDPKGAEIAGDRLTDIVRGFMTTCHATVAIEELGTDGHFGFRPLTDGTVPPFDWRVHLQVRPQAAVMSTASMPTLTVLPLEELAAIRRRLIELEASLTIDEAARAFVENRSTVEIGDYFTNLYGDGDDVPARLGWKTSDGKWGIQRDGKSFEPHAIPRQSDLRRLYTRDEVTVIVTLALAEDRKRR